MKKWSLFLLITVAVLSVFAPTEAVPTVLAPGNWQYIWEDRGAKMYIDTTRVSGGPDGPKDVWVRVNISPPDCTSGNAKSRNICLESFIAQSRYFSDKSYCILQGTSYFTDGTNETGVLPSCAPKKISSKGDKIWEYLYQ